MKLAKKNLLCVFQSMAPVGLEPTCLFKDYGFSYHYGFRHLLHSLWSGLYHHPVWMYQLQSLRLPYYRFASELGYRPFSDTLVFKCIVPDTPLKLNKSVASTIPPRSLIQIRVTGLEPALREEAVPKTAASAISPHPRCRYDSTLLFSCQVLVYGFCEVGLVISKRAVYAPDAPR